MSATLTNTTNNQPFILYAISNRPPGSSSSSSNSSASGSGAKNSRDPIQIICPYTGSNLTSTHSLRTPTSSSSNKNAFGIQCLLPVPLTNMMGSSGLGGGGGDDDGNSFVFIGHGGSYTSNNNNKNGGKDDYAFLLSRLSSSSSNNNNNNNPKWKVRCPQPLSKTFQSISISSNGRYVAAGTTSGSILLWDWTLSNGDNLINVWKGHYRSISCVLFNEEGNMLFSGGEDGVVNAWNVLDLIDIDNINNSSGASSSVHPFQTWSEHSLPITSLCVLSGSGSTTRLVSSSLDRNIILMELGCSGNGMIGTSTNSSNGRTLARICLPSGIHTVITNHATTSSSSCCSQRLYCGAHDGNVYCIDLDKFALHETTNVVGTSSSSYNSGTPTVVNVNQSDSSGAATRRRNMKNKEDNFESLLMGSHVLLPSSSNNNNNYTSELKGHVKAVTSLALLDPSSLLLSNNSATNVLLASGSDDGTLRIWDLNSRSCIKVLRPWSTTTSSSSSVGGVSSSSSSVSSSSSSPPITGIIVVPKSSLSSSSSFGGGGGINTTLVSSSSRSRRGSSNAHGSGDITSLFKPLKSFLRGTSVIQNSDTNDNVTESGKEGECITPILWPRRDDVQFWEETIKSSRRSEHDNNDDDDGGAYNTISRKRAKYNSDGVHVDDHNDEKTDQEEEITRLKKELAESQTVIKRWEAVNNQLITKLKNDNK